MSLSLLFNSLLIDNSVSILTGSWLYVDLIFSVTRVSFRCSDNLKSQTLPLQQNCPVITDLSKSLSFYFATFFFFLLLVDQVLKSSLILSQLLRQAESNSSITKVRIIQRMLWVHSFSPNQSFVNF